MHISRHVNKSLRSMSKGVFTPGKSATSLALVWTKYNVDFFSLVRFAFTLQKASEPEIVNKTAHVLRSSIYWTEILKQGKTASAKTG